jgi:hypothetical protein
VGGVGGPSLGDVRVPGVAQLTVLGEVLLWYEEHPRPTALDLAAYLYPTGGVAFDAEDVAVGQGLTASVDRPGVLPGTYEVADPCPVAVREIKPWRLHAACTDELVLDASCEVGRFSVGASEQDRVFSVEEVGEEPHRGFVVHGFAVPGTDPAVRVVCGYGGLVSAAELE